MENMGGPVGRPGRRRAPAARLWLRLWLWGESAWRDFLYLILPAECVVCGREDQVLCSACSAGLRRDTAAPFRAEHQADALVGVLGHPLLPVVAAGVYRDALAESLLAFKNHGRTELAAPLGRALARAMGVLVDELDPPTTSMLLMVPVPSTGGGWRRRGYDPVAMILRALDREGRLPAQAAIVPLLGAKAKLPWRRNHQKGLGRAARRRNIRNTMKIRRSKLRRVWLRANLSDASVVVVDDVLTTGSTLREAVKTLEMAGLGVCAGAVLAAARAPRGSHEIGPRNRLD
ncbi:ComF family protein [Arthrobacter sp. HLT1-20]